MRCCVTVWEWGLSVLVYPFLSSGTTADLQECNGQLECIASAPFSLTDNFLEKMMAFLLPLRKTIAPLDTDYEGHFLFILKKIWSKQRDESLGELIFFCPCLPLHCTTPHLHTALHPGGIHHCLHDLQLFLGHFTAWSPPPLYSLKVFTCLPSVLSSSLQSYFHPG